MRAAGAAARQAPTGSDLGERLLQALAAGATHAPGSPQPPHTRGTRGATQPGAARMPSPPTASFNAALEAVAAGGRAALPSSGGSWYEAGPSTRAHQGRPRLPRLAAARCFYQLMVAGTQGRVGMQQAAAYCDIWVAVL